MRVIDLENITYAMRNEISFVLRCEEVFRDKLSASVGTILSALPQKRIVALTGPSGSGKTTTALRLKEYLENMGANVCMLSMDNFFLPLDARPPEATDWESPYCVNRDRLHSTIDDLLAGKQVQMPWYDFHTGNVGGYRPMQAGSDAIIIAEGIHMLNPLLLDPIRAQTTGVYVAPRTRVITNDDHIVRPEQIRVARRMLRDYHGRGKSLRNTIERAQEVDRGEVQHIAPYKPNAAVHIDTFHDYELCLVAKYLRELPQFDAELDDAFVRAHGLEVLIEVVRELPPLHTDFVPRDSLVREFIGGSRFEY